MKKLLLSYHPLGIALKSENVYRVEKITGSVEYVPGQALSRACVHDLCQMTGMFIVEMIPAKETQS